MSSRPLIEQAIVMNAVSLAASTTSVITNIKMISICSYSLSWTGTPTGEFTVEVCNDYVPADSKIPAQTGNWVTIPLSEQVLANGDSGSAYIDIDTIGCTWIRLRYTRSSGTGSVTAFIGGKAA